MDILIEFLKINHFNYKLPYDIIEIIFEKYIIEYIINNSDNPYLIDDIKEPTIFIVKTLKKYNYVYTSKTLINAITSNNIKLVKYLLDNNIDIGESLKNAININNIDIIKELINNGAYVSDKHMFNILNNDNIELANYISDKCKINYYELITNRFNKNIFNKIIKWIISKKSYILLDMNNSNKSSLILNIIINEDYELLNIFISNKNLVLSHEILNTSLKNINIVKILNDYVKNNNNLYFYSYSNEQIFSNNCFLAILLQNNLELIELYFNSNIDETIFKYSINHIFKNDNVYIDYLNDEYYDILQFKTNTISVDIIKWLYQNLQINFDKITFCKITNNHSNFLLIDYI